MNAPRTKARRSTVVPQTLIVGADSVVGRALIERWQRAGKPVLGTTRRRETVSGSRLWLDLSEDAEKWRCPSSVTVALICAGITNLDACTRNAASSARVNVHGVTALAKNLIEQGVFVIYLSSNRVFDGTKAQSKTEDQVCPTTEYGRQKAEVEQHLLSFGAAASVVRFTKIVSPETPLLCAWIQAMQTHREVRPFSDAVMAPVSLAFAVDVLYCIAQARLAGIVHVSAEQDVTYEQVARHIAQRLGAAQDLIRPVRRDAASGREPIPAHTTLDTTRLRLELGMNPPEVWRVIDETLDLGNNRAAVHALPSAENRP